MSSADEYRRRRGRRTGAAAVAAVYSGDQRQATPPFPSVCRLVEKYTMLIERHRQNQQNGLTMSAGRRKTSLSSDGGVGRRKTSSSSDDAAIRANGTSVVATATGASCDRSSSLQSCKSAGLSSPVVSDDPAAWNRLLMDTIGGSSCAADEGDDDDDDDDGVNNGYVDGEGYGNDDDDDDGDCGRRFSCESLGSIQPGTCTRARCNNREPPWRDWGRGDKLPVTTCSRLSARARILRNDGPRAPCVSDNGFPYPACIADFR